MSVDCCWIKILRTHLCVSPSNTNFNDTTLNDTMIDAVVVLSETYLLVIYRKKYPFSHKPGCANSLSLSLSLSISFFLLYICFKIKDFNLIRNVTNYN